MKAVTRIFGTIEWATTLGVSYFLLQFAADRISHLLASKYVYGSTDGVDVWLTVLGFSAFISTFLLIHPFTRWYTAAALTAFLVIASLSSLSFGEPQPMLTPMLGLGSALVVLFSHRPSRQERDEELPSYVGIEHHG